MENRGYFVLQVDANNAYLVLEYIEGGMLSDCLVKRGNLEEVQAAKTIFVKFLQMYHIVTTSTSVFET